MISTRHNGNFVEVKKKYGGFMTKLACIQEYNTYMGGVDKADQMTLYYSSPRKTLRWHLKLLFHLFDLCIWNACCLFNFNKPKKEKKTYLQFRDSIISAWLQDPTPAAQSFSPCGSRHHVSPYSQIITRKRWETVYGVDTVL